MLLMHFLSSLLVDIEKTDLSLGNDALYKCRGSSIEVAMHFAMLQKISLFDKLSIFQVVPSGTLPW
jgi:hypothetical protein